MYLIFEPDRFRNTDAFSWCLYGLLEHIYSILIRQFFNLFVFFIVFLFAAVSAFVAMVLSEVEYSELMHVDNMGKHRLFYYNIARDVRDRMLQRNFDEFSCIWAEKIKTPHGIIVTKILKLDMSKLVSKVHKNVY